MNRKKNLIVNLILRLQAKNKTMIFFLKFPILCVIEVNYLTSEYYNSLHSSQQYIEILEQIKFPEDLTM